MRHFWPQNDTSHNSGPTLISFLNFAQWNGPKDQNYAYGFSAKSSSVWQMHHFGPQNDMPSELWIHSKDFFKKLANARGQEIHVNYMFFFWKKLIRGNWAVLGQQVHEKYINGFSEKILVYLKWGMVDLKMKHLISKPFYCFFWNKSWTGKWQNVLLVVWNCFLLLFVILRNEDGAAVIIRNGCPLVTCLVWLYNVMVPSEVTEIVPANSSQFF